MTQLPWQDNLLEDPSLTDIRFTEIEALKNGKALTYPTNPSSRPGTIVFMPPTHPTPALHLYLIQKARKLEIQNYLWEHKGIQDAIVARKAKQPDWDVKVLVNRNSYVNPGGTRDMILTAPALKQKDWFILGTGEGDVNAKSAGRILHRKAMIVDGVWFIHGSTNLEASSMEFQGNTLSITYDPALCAEMQKAFDRTRAYNIAKGRSWYQVP